VGAVMLRAGMLVRDAAASHAIHGMQRLHESAEAEARRRGTGRWHRVDAESGTGARTRP